MGLYFMRTPQNPMQGLQVRMDRYEQRECLVVFMPGMFDTPDTMLERGLLNDAAAASRRCDLVALDAHIGYYRSGAIRERVGEDVLRLAENRGYRDVWFVGVSMGGLGSMVVTEANPHLVRGVVLLAPFLGEESFLESIRDSGGLADWEAPEDAEPTNPNEYQQALWAWLQGYASEPELMPELYIGVGQDDPRVGVELLEEVLPEGRVGRAPGGHDWVTWRALFRRLLQSPPWDPRRGPPSMDERGASAGGPVSGTRAVF